MKRTIVIAILGGLVGLVLGFIAANVIFQIRVDDLITEVWRAM
jgi:ABC-type antimicrobial peptide transport system permease subunit